MRALILSAKTDPNGEAMRYKAAAERHGGVAIRSVARSSHGYKRMPVDIYFANNEGAIQRLWAEADVIHLNNSLGAWEQFHGDDDKPVLLHHHGTAFRVDPEPLLARARRLGWLSAASTLDLAEIAPDEVIWLPTPYDLDALAELRRAHRREPDGTVLVMHAPTFRSIKGTAAVVAAVETLQGEGLPVELELIEQTSWAECLRRKARADIFIDQLLLGYGCNAVEAWGMGIPVIAGVDPERAAEVNHPIPVTTRDRMLREFDGRIPFCEASEQTLTDRLRELVADAELRQAWALAGMSHADRFHAQAPALERLLALYRHAITGTRIEAVA